VSKLHEYGSAFAVLAGASRCTLHRVLHAYVALWCMLLGLRCMVSGYYRALQGTGPAVGGGADRVEG
jgi:hypothetical protein